MPKAYEDIADELRHKITTGQLGPGDRLPSEEELRQTYDKGVPTIRAALDVLLFEGLIDKQHGRGTFVRVPRRLVRRTNERHQWEKDRAREPLGVRAQTGATEHDTGLDISDLIFSARYHEVEATEDLASLLEVPVGTALVERAYQTRYARERAPFNVSRSYLIRNLVAANPDLLDETKEPWPGGTQNQLLTVGIEIERVVETIVSARTPTQDEAKILGMSPGMAIIELRKLSIDTAGRVVEAANVLLPGDRTEITFVTKLERW